MWAAPLNWCSNVVLVEVVWLHLGKGFFVVLSSTYGSIWIIGRRFFIVLLAPYDSIWIAWKKIMLSFMWAALWIDVLMMLVEVMWFHFDYAEWNSNLFLIAKLCFVDCRWWILHPCLQLSMLNLNSLHLDKLPTIHFLLICILFIYIEMPLQERGILQEVEQNNEVAKESFAENSRSFATVDVREGRALDVLWFLKPCTLSGWNNWRS